MARPRPPAGEMVVSVFFTCDLDASPVPSYRLTPVATAVLRASLEQLVAGPTQSEADAGVQSWFSSSTAMMLADVTISDGHAVVDFHDLRTLIPNASSSAGSRMLLSQLDATVFQFSTVSSVVYRIEGDCGAFNEWLQLGGCEPRTR
jgi:spore germination protein GerM